MTTPERLNPESALKLFNSALIPYAVILITYGSMFSRLRVGLAPL